MRIRILLLIKLMEMWDNWSIYPQPQGSILNLQASIAGVHGPPRLYFESPKLLNLYFNADPDPDPAFLSNEDPDPNTASKNNANPCGSGSTTLVVTTEELPVTLARNRQEHNPAKILSDPDIKILLSLSTFLQLMYK
jgi:hypothetical protein